MKIRFFPVFPLLIIITAFLTVSMVAIPLREARAAQATLVWDAPDAAVPDGYKVYYGTASGAYTASVDAGNATRCTVSGLDAGRTYYFAATAYYPDGSESGFSNEAVKAIPLADDTTAPSSDNDATGGDVEVLAFNFDTDSEDFAYNDDLFRSTSQPLYAEGGFDLDGGYTGGGIEVTLGGIDYRNILDGMSAGWRTTIEVVEAGQIFIRFRYRLVMAGEYETDEYSQVVAAVDGTLVGVNGESFLLEMHGTEGNTTEQDSGWRTASLAVDLAVGRHTIAIGAWSNKKTGAREATTARFDDVLISLPAPDGSNSVDTSLAFGFDAGVDGFAFRDDTFRGTDRPEYASGQYEPDGGMIGGGLSVALGGIDSVNILDGISAGWARSFEVAESGPVSISLRCRLTMAGEYETDEHSQALLAVDGRLFGTGGGDSLLELRGTDGNTPLQDTGWQGAVLELDLSKGRHTLTVGAWNNKKTGSLEETRAYFDDIEIHPR